MKKILFLICISVSFNCFSQSENQSVSRLTELMLEKNYSASDRIELNKYPIKLKELDYIYSKSFQVAEHQNYTASQFEKIDVNKYNLTRKLDEYVLVFDQDSGLQLVLFSLNKMEADKKMLSPLDKGNQDPTHKIAR